MKAPRKRRTFDVTMRVTVPVDMRPERVKMEIQARINEVTQWSHWYPGASWPDEETELGEKDVLAKAIRVKVAK